MTSKRLFSILDYNKTSLFHICEWNYCGYPRGIDCIYIFIIPSIWRDFNGKYFYKSSLHAVAVAYTYAGKNATQSLWSCSSWGNIWPLKNYSSENVIVDAVTILDPKPLTASMCCRSIAIFPSHIFRKVFFFIFPVTFKIPHIPLE